MNPLVVLGTFLVWFVADWLAGIAKALLVDRARFSWQLLPDQLSEHALPLLTTLGSYAALAISPDGSTSTPVFWSTLVAGAAAGTPRLVQDFLVKLRALVGASTG